MHGVQVVHKRLHRLVCRPVNFFICVFRGFLLDGRNVLGVDDLLQILRLDFLISIVVGKNRPDVVFIHDLLADGFHFLNAFFDIEEKVEHLSYIRPVELPVGFHDAVSHAVVEIRDALSAVLVVLVGLDRDAGQSGIALDVIRLSEMTVTRRKAALEELLDVDLAASRGKRQEVHIVNVDIALSVRLGMLWLKYEHFVELLRALAAVLEHGAHSRIAVDIGVFTLGVIIFRVFERQILISLHEPCVHVSDPGTLRSVEDELLRSPGVSVLDQDLLNCVLDLLYSRDLVVAYFYKVEFDLSGQIVRCVSVLPSQDLSCLVDCI